MSEMNLNLFGDSRQWAGSGKRDSPVTSALPKTVPFPDVPLRRQVLGDRHEGLIRHFRGLPRLQVSGSKQRWFARLCRVNLVFNVEAYLATTRVLTPDEARWVRDRIREISGAGFWIRSRSTDVAEIVFSGVLFGRTVSSV